jgi:hypothetical protein
MGASFTCADVVEKIHQFAFKAWYIEKLPAKKERSGKVCQT